MCALRDKNPLLFFSLNESCWRFCVLLLPLALMLAFFASSVKCETITVLSKRTHTWVKRLSPSPHRFDDFSLEKC